MSLEDEAYELIAKQDRAAQEEAIRVEKSRQPVKPDWALKLVRRLESRSYLSLPVYLRTFVGQDSVGENVFEPVGRGWSLRSVYPHHEGGTRSDSIVLMDDGTLRLGGSAGSRPPEATAFITNRGIAPEHWNMISTFQRYPVANDTFAFYPHYRHRFGVAGVSALISGRVKRIDVDLTWTADR